MAQFLRQAPGLSVLLVEDDALLRETLRRMLAAEGHHVVLACDRYRAAAAIRGIAFDLLIIDVLFPQAQIIDALVERNRTGARSRIIGLSRFARILPDYYLALTAKLGVRVILAKPFDRSQLAEAIAESGPGTEPELVGAARSAVA